MEGKQMKETIKAKAKEILESMFIGSIFDYPDREDFKKAKQNAKQCALIHVNGIIESHKKYPSITAESPQLYWEKVKQEIEQTTIK